MSEKIRVIIAGGRDFKYYDLLKYKCNSILKDLPKDDFETISGGAKGADKLGERYAIEKGYIFRRFEADWDAHGNSAAPIRNKEMALAGTHLIAFWDGISKGTKNMIEEANQAGLKVRIIKY